MLTIHADSRGRALAVRDEWVLASGPLEELTGAHPLARVRRWPGILTSGLVNPHGPELLEQAYHPDPREAGELGTEPLTGGALNALAIDETRWGASARRGVQRMLARGTVVVAGTFSNRAVVAAVRRSGIGVTGRLGVPGGVPSLDPFGSGLPVDFPPARESGSAARFAVFDVRDEAELAERGGGSCVVTVVAGRIVFRRK
ncbi:hypothetical protein ACIHCM_30900 [Streptomyces sp. NPDC052023]|uniref:hypothetical protein n=1 Tax=Streptomyces sp. NPDC052023 TaxID=3365681 RepID=UPI0037CE254E